MTTILCSTTLIFGREVKEPLCRGGRSPDADPEVLVVDVVGVLGGDLDAAVGGAVVVAEGGGYFCGPAH